MEPYAERRLEEAARQGHGLDHEYEWPYPDCPIGCRQATCTHGPEEEPK
jgi:hypothetical protein